MREILTFPTPYPNELFYSVFARYQRYTGKTIKEINKEFGLKERKIPSLEIFGFLNNVSNKLGSPYSIDNILNNHSLINLYLPLITKREQKIALEALKNGDNARANKTLRIIGAVNKKKAIRYCPDCAREDIELYGESYIHKEHQIPGILCCFKHSKCLLEYNSPNDTLSKYTYLDKDYLRDTALYFSDIHKKVALMAVDFINTVPIGTSKEELVGRYRTLLIKYRYLKGSSINIQNLIQDIKEEYGDILPLYGADKTDMSPLSKIIELEAKEKTSRFFCPEEMMEPSNWTSYTVFDSNVVVPLVKQLLLVNMFCNSIKDFWNIEPTIFKKKFDIPGVWNDRGLRKNKDDAQIKSLIMKAHEELIHENKYRVISKKLLFRKIGLERWKEYVDQLPGSIEFAASVEQLKDQRLLIECEHLIKSIYSRNEIPTFIALKKEMIQNNPEYEKTILVGFNSNRKKINEMIEGIGEVS
jgi:hypothetical protein